MKHIGSVTYHFDVWGHQFRNDCPDCGSACEGWQVNDSRSMGEIVFYKHSDERPPSLDEIRAALPEDAGEIVTHDDGETWEQKEDGRPVFFIDWTEERERLKFSVEFEVDETWIADGFDLDDDRAMDMLRKTLGWAREDELGARVLSAPDPELIKWFQGGLKVRP